MLGVMVDVTGKMSIEMRYGLSLPLSSCYRFIGSLELGIYGVRMATWEYVKLKNICQ